MEEDEYYPEKPDLIEEKSKSDTARSLLSLALFVLAFVAFGGGDTDYSFILFVVAVLFVHEMGHFSLMKLFGYKNVSMRFVPFLGAFVRGKKDRYTQKQSLLVVLAGPIPGILLGLILGYIGVKQDIEWLKSLSFLFLAINMINLLPLDPLDGGQILKLLIRRNQEKFQLVFSFISSLFLIGIGFYFEMWILLIFGFLMGIRVRSIQKKYLIHKELDGDKVNYKTTYTELSKRDFAKIKEVVFDNTPALRNYVDQIPSEKIDPIIADQVNSVLIAPVDRDASFVFRLIAVLVWFSAIIAPFVLVYLINKK
jgi:Zn-dependent protease